MAKGGGFSGGGGFKGGGFGGGGFKGSGSGKGFSGGQKVPNHVYRNTGSSFLRGVIIGSLLNSGRRTTVVKNMHPVYSDEYMERKTESAQPQTKQVKVCQYCMSEFTDESLTRCPNCGATLTTKEKTTTSSFSRTMREEDIYYKPTPKAQTNTKKDGKTMLFVVIAVVLAIIALTVFSSHNKVLQDKNIYTWVPVYTQDMVQTNHIGEKVTSKYLSFIVEDYEVRNEVEELGIAYDGDTYILVKVTIKNSYPDLMPIFIRDFSIVVNGVNYQALHVNHDDFYSFNYGSGLSKYFTIQSYGQVSKYFIYRLQDYNYSNSDFKFEYLEYEYVKEADQNVLIGVYDVIR
jgi:DNA-directed RNA polymerase subunit RPC12/RpoP